MKFYIQKNQICKSVHQKQKKITSALSENHIYLYFAIFITRTLVPKQYKCPMTSFVQYKSNT